MFHRSRAWAVGLLFAAFAAGVAVGAATVAWGDRDDRDGRNRGPRMSFIERLDRELSLTPAQRDSVRAILARHDRTTDEIWRESRRRFETMRLQVRDEIARVLTDEQQVKFRAMNARADSLRAARQRGSDRE